MNIHSERSASATLGGRPMSSARILSDATALAPMLRETVDHCDELGYLPPHVMEALREAGVFRIAFPAALGGPDMRIADQVRLIALLSEANPSVGWNVMILADSGYFAGRFDPAAAREIWPRLDMATSALRNPPARAERVEGGYRLSGRFGFASGVRNADRISLPCFRFIDDKPVLGPDGQPELCVAFLPIASIAVHDTWDTIGLRGTGSNQISVDGAFVQASHLIPHSAPLLSAAPLSRYVNLMYANQVGVILGITKALLQRVQNRIVAKLTPEKTPLRDHYRARVEIPYAWGLYQAACAYVHEAASECDARLFANEPVPPETMAKVISMSVIAPALCRKAVDGVLDIVATDQIFRSTGIDRLYLDLRVASTHIVHRREWLQKSEHWLGASLPS